MENKLARRMKGGNEDLPSKATSQFLRKRASSDFSLHIQELEQDGDNFTLPPLSKSQNCLSFDEPGSSEAKMTKVLLENQQQGGSEEVLRCPSNACSSLKTKPRLLTMAAKNKSRLSLPDQTELSPKSGGDRDWDEDDPFEEDYKKAGFNLVLLERVSLIIMLGALVISLTIPSFRTRTLWNLTLWKWEVMVLVLIGGRLVCSWAVRIIVFFIERNFVTRKRLLYFVYGLRKAVQNCFWLGLISGTWYLLFDRTVQREINSKTLQLMTKFLVCLWVGAVIWLVKTFVVKCLACSFHVKTYFNRIQVSLFNQSVIEILSRPAPACGRVTRQNGKDNGEEGTTVDHLKSTWNMKKLGTLVQYGNITTLDEQVLVHDKKSTKKINSESKARAVAERIFKNVAQQGSRHIHLEDLLRFMGEEKAVNTLSLFEGAKESQKISKSSLKNWVVNVFKERRALALTLNDTKTAVDKLHRMVNIVVGFLIAFLWLHMLGIATEKFLLIISSQLLLVVFIFGNTCKTIFEAIIFLFVMHPFDVGDHCEIDDVQVVVEEMNILTTAFLRYDNRKIIIPNSVLATKVISNYNRSPDIRDEVEFCVHMSTSKEKIAMMKERIMSYIENEEEHWHPAPVIIFRDVEENRLRLAIRLMHRMNHQDMDEKLARRALLVGELVQIFKDLEIQV